MNLKHLQFFVELAHTEHMAKAAENLGISQPSLSYAISNIEHELGAPLFEKDGRNIKLTNYGKIYLKYVQESLNELKQGSKYINELLDINSGHINLGFTYTLGQDLLPHLVSVFKKQEENKNIKFSFKQDTTEHLINDILNDKLDLVCSSMPEQNLDQLCVHHLVDQQMKVAVPLQCSLANKKSVYIKELEKCPFIMYSHKSGLRPKIDQIFSTVNFKPKVALEAVEDHAIIGFVHWGFGIAIVPNLPQLNDKTVKLLDIKDKIAKHSLYIITKNNHFLSPVVNKFQNFAQHYCQENYINKNKLI